MLLQIGFMSCARQFGLPKRRNDLYAGVYVGVGDKIPIGAFMNKGLTLKTGQTHMQKYMPMLLEKHPKRRDIDPSFIITHEVPLEEAPQAYQRSSTSRTAASRWC